MHVSVCDDILNQMLQKLDFRTMVPGLLLQAQQQNIEVDQLSVWDRQWATMFLKVFDILPLSLRVVKTNIWEMLNSFVDGKMTFLKVMIDFMMHFR